MKCTVIFVGKTVQQYLKTGVDDYYSRIKHYAPFEIVELPDIKNTKSLSQSQIKVKEGELILKNIDTADYVVLTDQGGKEFSSVDFSQWLMKKIGGNANIKLIIGGAYGFSDDVYNRANELISLSKMTFSHQMVRLFLVEQLYRAFTISKNEKYHH